MNFPTPLTYFLIENKNNNQGHPNFPDTFGGEHSF